MALKKKYLQATLTVPKYLTPEQRVALGVEVVNYIRERSADGKDVSGSAFQKYTKAYLNSRSFDVAGKTSNVDLKLTGDMLAMLRVIGEAPGKITIGYRADDEVAGRVEGNQAGTYGQKKPVQTPRKFIGFEGKEIAELKKLIANYPRNFDERQARADQVMTTEDVAGDVADDILVDIGEG